ncbi:MAG: hypothetical protein ACI8QD_001615 [Cyclobacteriaceae bacterium]|jgi:hypothetical protein
MKPALSSVPQWYHNYVNLAQEGEIVSALDASNDAFLSMLSPLTEQKFSYRYEPNKWSIKELVQHLADAERIFSYRALRIARRDRTVLSGYDHNSFVSEAGSDVHTSTTLIEELSTVRAMTIAMYRTFDASVLDAVGQVDENTFTPRSLGYIIAGHMEHHRQVIMAKYLSRL